MKIKQLVAFAYVGACLILVSGIIHGVRSQAAPPPARHPAWEYARFADLSTPGRDSYWFYAPDRAHQDASIHNLSLSVRGLPPAPGDGNILELLNAVGLQGWELAGDREGRFGREILFKRVVP